VAKNDSNLGQEPKSSRKFRYDVAYDLVIDLIVSRNLKPGDRLPSAKELSALSEVSMISVRHALDKLEKEGRIRRHQGVGTFVAREKIVSEPSRSGELLQTLTESRQDLELSTTLIHFGVGLPSEGVAKALSIELGQPVWEVVRCRSLGSWPAILEKAILPLSCVPSLDKQCLEEGASLYRFLADAHGLHDEHSEQFFEVVKPRKAERDVLNITARENVVRIRGVSFTGDDVAFDCWQQTYRASEFIFYLAGRSNRRLLQPSDIDTWEVQPLAGLSSAYRP
jgi:DNA-binding GntR family transcriptional regulator